MSGVHQQAVCQPLLTCGNATLPPNDLLLAMVELVTGKRLDLGRAYRHLTPDEFRARQEILKARFGVPAPMPHLFTFH